MTIMLSESGIILKTRRLVNILLGSAFLILGATALVWKRPSWLSGMWLIEGVIFLVLASVYFYRAWRPREMDSPENLSVHQPPRQ